MGPPRRVAALERAGQRALFLGLFAAWLVAANWGKFDGLFAGTVTRTENQTNRVRIFMAFKSWQGSVDFLIDRVRSRGLHIGGTTHLVLKMVIASVEDLARAYFKEWVRGSATAEPDDATKGNFVSMYNQALTRVT